jgi:hypothetical protein
MIQKCGLPHLVWWFATSAIIVMKNEYMMSYVSGYLLRTAIF